MKREKSIKGLFKTKMVGDSLYLLIDKKTREYLGANENEFLMARISTVQEKTLICPVCKHESIILSNDDVFDCPLCGKEFTLAQGLGVEDIIIKQPADDIYLIEGNDNKAGSLKGGICK